MRATIQYLTKVKPKNVCLSSTKSTSKEVKKYSTHKVRNYDSNNNDINANTNNPQLITRAGNVIRHMEVTRQECDKVPVCKDKVCSTICGNIKEEESVGHLTGGNINNAQGHTVNLGNTDINGNPKPQNIFVYKTPHKTSPTQTEIPDGTTYVTQAQVENIINKVES